MRRNFFWLLIIFVQPTLPSGGEGGQWLISRTKGEWLVFRRVEVTPEGGGSVKRLYCPATPPPKGEGWCLQENGPGGFSPVGVSTSHHRGFPAPLAHRPPPLVGGCRWLQKNNNKCRIWGLWCLVVHPPPWSGVVGTRSVGKGEGGTDTPIEQAPSSLSSAVGENAYCIVVWCCLLWSKAQFLWNTLQWILSGFFPTNVTLHNYSEPKRFGVHYFSENFERHSSLMSIENEPF